MCHKLFQVYGCSHTAEICTTPCTHAVNNATPAPKTSPEAPNNDARISNLTRPGPALGHRPSVSSVTSLPAASTIARKPTDGPSPQPAAAVRTTSLSNLTTPPRRESLLPVALQPRGSIDLAPPPYTQTRTNTGIGIGEVEMIPSYCAQFFARYLPMGSHPCLDCYMRPGHEAYRKKYMKIYFDGHPGCKLEDVEELSGIAEIARRQGLVNVAREVNTAESGKVGELQGETETEKK